MANENNKKEDWFYEWTKPAIWYKNKTLLCIGIFFNIILFATCFLQWQSKGKISCKSRIGIIHQCCSDKCSYRIGQSFYSITRSKKCHLHNIQSCCNLLFYFGCASCCERAGQAIATHWKNYNYQIIYTHKDVLWLK